MQTVSKVHTGIYTWGRRGGIFMVASIIKFQEVKVKLTRILVRTDLVTPGSLPTGVAFPAVSVYLLN